LKSVKLDNIWIQQRGTDTDRRKLHVVKLENRVKEYEVGRAYSTNGRKLMHVGFCWEIQNEREH
jgi:hypothetical protein